jgi:ABC-type multidrug transport system ATPase subunit
VLYTTHYMEEAERLCDRVVIMDHGRVVASDTLAGLYRRLPAVETLELEIDGIADLAALVRETPATRPVQDGTRLHVGVADLGGAAPALLAWLAAREPVVAAADEDAAALGDDEAAQHRHRGRLAGAVRPEQADDLARADLQREIVDDDPAAVRFALSLGFEHRGFPAA